MSSRPSRASERVAGVSPRASIPRSSAAGLAWPALPDAVTSRLLALQQQLEHSEWWPRAQVSRDELEIRLVARRALTPDEEAAVIDRVNRNYGGDFRCRIGYCREIPREASGKYFVFRRELPA